MTRMEMDLSFFARNLVICFFSNKITLLLPVLRMKNVSIRFACDGLSNQKFFMFRIQESLRNDMSL